jgi:hypothetical protein
MFANHNAGERRMNYTSIGPLTGPEGVGYAATYAVEPVYRQFITTDCENPEPLQNDCSASAEYHAFASPPGKQTQKLQS